VLHSPCPSWASLPLLSRSPPQGLPSPSVFVRGYAHSHLRVRREHNIHQSVLNQRSVASSSPLKLVPPLISLPRIGRRPAPRRRCRLQLAAAAGGPRVPCPARLQWSAWQAAAAIPAAGLFPSLPCPPRLRLRRAPRAPCRCHASCGAGRRRKLPASDGASTSASAAALRPRSSERPAAPSACPQVTQWARECTRHLHAASTRTCRVHHTRR